jgi:hypothetical protein
VKQANIAITILNDICHTVKHNKEIDDKKAPARRKKEEE